MTCPGRSGCALLAFAISLGWLLGGCGTDKSAGPAGHRTLALESCRPPGIAAPAQCGTLRVFEDRTAAAGRQLDLHVVVIPAVARHPEPDPLFLLAGGPGQSATQAFGPILPALDEIRKQRDLVLVDQRGTGHSGALHCDTEAEDVADMFSDRGVAEIAQRCLSELTDQADLTHYHTALAADDLDDVRAALGYERINLYGLSYGTRAALVYVRRHASRVRSVILDGVAPPTMVLAQKAAQTGQRAFDAMVDDCQKDEHCRKAFPELRASFEEFVQQLSRAPLQTRVRHPRTGESIELSVTRNGFVRNVFALLYSAELTSLLPLTITKARGGDFSSFMAQAMLFNDSLDESMSYGLHLSVVCAEDVPRMVDADLSVGAAGTFVGDCVARDLQRACADWPRAAVPADHAAPVRSDVPTLLLSGQLDPVTPPATAEEALAHLGRAKHVIVPGVAHGTGMVGCVPELLAKLVETADPNAIDASCVEQQRRPRFFIDFAGPAH